MSGRRGKRDDVDVVAPSIVDGAALWRIARDSGKLDLNSSYAYLLWCRDFAATSRLARIDGTVAGYVTGYLRPDAPDTLVVWQVAVDQRFRGRGLAGTLLDELVADMAAKGARYLETTVTPDNEASVALFAGLARRLGTEHVRTDLFLPEHFPDGHQTEVLHRIGPFRQ
jgi:L-2,4-diaminobutyric acid acetyltransferase